MSKQGRWIYLVAVLVAVIALGVWVRTGVMAGELEPPGSPAPTMHTLEEIYNKIGSMDSETGSALGSSDSRSLPMVVQEGAPLYVSVTGAIQDLISEGASTAEGREDMIEVVGLQHQVSVPVDQGTGLPTGTRRHSPIAILKYVDKASPRLFQACVTGEQLTSVDIRFYRIDPATRAEVAYYIIHLEGGIISEVSQAFPNLERVSMTYANIEWNWLPDGILATDSWAGTAPAKGGPK